MDELFGVATLLSSQPLPRGRRVAIVTNGGGPGILAADACERNGLNLPELSTETTARLKSVIKRDITVGNPVDMTAGAGGAEFEGALRVLARDEGNDAVIAIFIPPVLVDIAEVRGAIRKVAPLFRKRGKPLLACTMGQPGFPGKPGSGDRFVPSYSFPEDAVLALARTAEYGEWQKRPTGTIPKITGIRRRRARQIIETALTSTAQRPLWLAAREVTELLGCYGIRMVETVAAKTEAEAGLMAAKIGFPVVVKLASATIVHKTDVGGVKIDLKSATEVKGAFRDISARLTGLGRRGEMEGVVVQRLVRGGVEAIVGVTQDPSFGPLIMFGLGGIYAELLRDVAVRLHPLTDLDARELVSSIKMARLFSGFRGAPPSDVAALEDLLLRLSALVEDVAEIAELDLNPVKVMPQGEGYWVVDARVMLR
jgi:acetyltransferase